MITSTTPASELAPSAQTAKSMLALTQYRRSDLPIQKSTIELGFILRKPPLVKQSPIFTINAPQYSGGRPRSLLHFPICNIAS
jgi:hypothetical protein